MACSNYSADVTTTGFATKSTESGPAPATNAFDDNSSTGWQAASGGSLPEWIGQDFGAGNAKAIVRGDITVGTYGASFPEDFKFQGSNNGSDWTDLNSVTNAGFSNNETKSYEWDNLTEYRYVRLYITDTANPAEQAPTVNELELFTCNDISPYEIISVTENITTELSDRTIYDSQESIGATESISVQLFQTTLDVDSGGDTIAVTENISIEQYEYFVLPSGQDNIAVTESISIQLFDAWLYPNISETVVITENINPSIGNYVSETQNVRIEEYVRAALDIPTSWIALSNQGLTKEKYYFTLTGDADGTTDIEIPITSFQARKRTGEATYLSVIIRGFETYASAVAARANGEMIVEMNYEYDGQSSIRQEILRADLEDIKLYEGANNRSIGLTGHKIQTFANRSVTLENPTYKATVEGKRTFRFAKCDPYLNPGDTLVVGADSMTVDYITYIVSSSYKSIEVREIA